MASAVVRVDRDGVAKVGDRTYQFSRSLAGATVTIDDGEDAADDDGGE